MPRAADAAMMTVTSHLRAAHAYLTLVPDVEEYRGVLQGVVRSFPRLKPRLLQWNGDSLRLAVAAE
jgi:hypothetical protein